MSSTAASTGALLVQEGWSVAVASVRAAPSQNMHSSLVLGADGDMPLMGSCMALCWMQRCCTHHAREAGAQPADTHTNHGCAPAN